MATTITLKGIPDELYERLKASAEANRRSLNSEVIVRLESVVMPRVRSAAEHLSAIRAVRARLPPGEFDHDEVDRLKRQGRA